MALPHAAIARLSLSHARNMLVFRIVRPSFGSLLGERMAYTHDSHHGPGCPIPSRAWHVSSTPLSQLVAHAAQILNRSESDLRQRMSDVARRGTEHGAVSHRRRISRYRLSTVCGLTAKVTPPDHLPGRQRPISVFWPRGRCLIHRFISRGVMVQVVGNIQRGAGGCADIVDADLRGGLA